MMGSLLMVLVPLTMMAQIPGGATDTKAPVPTVENGQSVQEPARPVSQQAPPAPPPDRRRREGTMVGYVDDAIVESKLRVRFDAGFENTVPDRAEFFYPKCGCFGGDAPGPQPGAARDLDFQQLQLVGEYAFHDRVSAFAQVPLRWIQPQDFIAVTLGGAPTGFSDSGGLGDIRVGAKFGLAASNTRHVTVQTQVFFPTGDAAKGLGTDHASFEPALLYYQRVSNVIVLESQAGVWIPFGGSSGDPSFPDEDFAGNVFSYGIGSSFEVYDRGRVHVAPIVELVGWRVTGGLQTLDRPTLGELLNPAEGTNIVNLKFGARISIDRGSFYVGYGHALTDATWYDSIFRLEYRYSFGR